MTSIWARLMTRIKSGGSRPTGVQVGDPVLEDPVPSQGEMEPEPLELTANIRDERMYSWESQATQYPPSGPPGISYFRGEVSDERFRGEESDERFVDCLLYRDEAGELVGILNRYPTGFPPHEREGDQNIWVRPDHRRQGIGSALLTEAFFRWGGSPNADDLKLTESGVQLLKGMEEKRSVVARLLPAPPKIVCEEWCDGEGMREWMCPRPAIPTRIEFDPRVGGHYRIDFEDERAEHSVTGRYVTVEPPRGVSFTWRCATWESSALDSVVTVQLEPRDEDRTLMTIRHGRLAADLRDEYKAHWGRIAAQLEVRLAER